MPFTFSHPAIVLPLTYLPKRWISLTGLVVGSVVPDFEYFLRMKVLSTYSHTFKGLLWFDIPFGLLLAFLFHSLVRNSLFENLPWILKSRLVVFETFNWNNYFTKNWIVIIISILLGAALHIFWDSFTHDHGYFVLMFSVLQEKIGLLGLQFPISKIIQHVSTLIGGSLIIISLLKFPIHNGTPHNLDLKYWILCFIIASIILMIRISFGIDFQFYGHLIVSGMSAMLCALVLTPLIIRIKLSLNP